VNQSELLKNRIFNEKGEDITYVTIWDKAYYFSYQCHPFSLLGKSLDFTKPYEEKDWVNYEIDSAD
jgi:hypothetical protein